MPPPSAPAGSAGGSYIFSDEFDGPAGAGPDPAKWTVQTWQDDVFPPVEGIYRAQNVFLDGNSNLVLQATREGDQYYSGKVRGNWRGPSATPGRHG
ncbi:glycosyl hydrolases family protein 16 [Mycobacterium xenopi 3993]|nr:glycosyl hydrolases family protein 16 [Mycobacterium xenopi 3993]